MKGEAMKERVKKAVIPVLALLLMGTWWIAPAFGKPGNGGPQAGDFALLDEEPTVADQSVFCGATRATGNQPAPFTMHITMTNRGDLGGVAGFVRVTYLDTDFVDYAIPPNTTVQITLVGGNTPGVDDAIKVSGDGAGGSVLIGQASIILHTSGKPHPLLGGTSFCITIDSTGVEPF